MRAFSAAEVVAVWETGALQHPLDRALTMLAAAFPDKSRADLARLSIGQRDHRLWELRQRAFGSDVVGLTACPECGVRVEFQFLISDIQAGASDSSGQEHQLHAGPWHVCFRLPDSRDLAAIAVAGGCQRAAAQLVAKCVLSAKRNECETALDDVPAEILEAVERKMSELDPQAELRMDLHCANCGHKWQTWFDIADFAWTEVAAMARRLMRDVDVLARTYGWSEAEILGLTPVRRRAYLQLCGL